MEKVECKKVLLICGISQTVITFRLSLIKAMQNKGYIVSVIALDDDYKDEILANGIEFYSVDAENRSLNPFGMKKLQNEYYALIKSIIPDMVFSFMLKPNIFGVRAARKAGVNLIFSMVEGVGDVFIYNNFKWRIIRKFVCKMYQRSFKYSKKIFFLNNDDKSEFLSRKLLKTEQCEIIDGIGVDVNYFGYKPIENYNTFLMIARMLETKGVLEYCQAARIVKQKYPEAIFNYLGAEGTLKISDIKEYIDDGSVNYLGVTRDVRPYIKECAVYVLPSYREGMPVSIMEAASVGRPIITTNVPGCKDVVINELNGFLVDKANVDQLVDKMTFFLENANKVNEMSKSSRTLACEKFDKDIINKKILSILEL